MRVALVSEHASPLAALGSADAGGQNVHVAALATALGALGHEVTVHTRRDRPDLAAHVEMAPRVRVHHVDAGPALAVPKDDLLGHMLAFGDALGAYWEQWRPDVAHAHFWMSGVATLRAAVPLGIPVAQTFHALGTVKRRFQGLSDTSPRHRLGEEARLAREVDRIIATCTDEVAELCRMGIAPTRSTVVPCGVDTETFHADGAVEPRPSGRHRLLSIGRLVPRKGVDDVIRALQWLPHTELVVAGGAPEDRLDEDAEVQRLRRIAADVGVEPRVRFLGGVDRARVPALMRSADVVVAYPWYEPFGMVPLEAMSCGVPIVVSDVGGMRDTVRHDVTGLRVAARSPAALGRALLPLLADPERRAQMGVAGAHRARQRYAWSRVADLTGNVYAQLRAGAGVERKVV